MSSAEFSEHYADFQEAPWGPDADNIRNAHLTMTVANMAGKQLKAPGSLTDFLLWHKVEAEELPPPSEFFRGQ